MSNNSISGSPSTGKAEVFISHISEEADVAGKLKEVIGQDFLDLVGTHHERTAPRMDLNRLAARLQAFAQERDWEQFHTPKNLAIALSVEAGELLELFQWLTPEGSFAVADAPADAVRVQQELADVFLYLVRLAAVLGIDLEAAVEAKLQINAEKYPIALAHGNAIKSSRRADG